MGQNAPKWFLCVLDMDVNAAVNQFNYTCFVISFENGQRIHYDLVFTAN